MERVNFKSLVNPESILVINSQSHLRRLYCPFRVRCIHPVGTIKANSWVYVDRVIPDEKELILYRIGDFEYPYRHFHIYIFF